MTAVIAIPELAGLVSEPQATEMLLRPVAGVPLLRRTALTVVRAGASQVLLICPVALSDRLLQSLAAELTLPGVQVTALRVESARHSDRGT